MANYYLEHTGSQLDEAIRKVNSGFKDVSSVTAIASDVLIGKQIIGADGSVIHGSLNTDDYYNNGYDLGHDVGYNEGHATGFDEGRDVGHDEGYNEGYSEGYEAGYNAEKPYMMELEYIQSSGTQYIDTGFKPNSNTRVLIDTEVISSGTTFLFGSRHNSSANSTSYSFSMVQISGTSLRSDYGSSETEISLNPIQRLIIDKNKNITTINGTSVSATTQTFQGSYNLCLFTVNTAGTINSTKTSARLYSCQIYDNGILVRDYIPVLDWNGVACLFDKVNQTLVYNSGTGKFGSNRYTPLEYIESTGTQYIDTGFTPDDNTKIEIEFSIVDTTTNAFVYGARPSAWGAGMFTLPWLSAGNFQPTFNSAYTDLKPNSAEWYVGGHDHNTITLNGTSVTIADATFTSPCTMYLFASNNAGAASSIGKFKVRRASIYDNGTLVRDYVPCLDSNGVPCLYDKVNKTFTYNKGTGTFKYPGSTPSVNSIKTTGSYDSASYHGEYWAAIDNNGTLLLVVNGGTNTSYESIYFTTSSIPSGVTFLKQSYYSYSSMSVSVPYVAVFSGITSSVDITLNFSGVNSSSDYVTCTVTIT